MYPTIRILNVDLATFQIFAYVAILAAILVYLLSGKYNQLFRWSVFRVGTLSIMFAALGGRLLSAFVLTQNGLHSFIYNFINGGEVFYGGLIGGSIGLYLWCKIKRVSFFDYTDVLAMLLPLCQAVGRIGCYYNGCCYGRLYSGLLSVPYVVDKQIVRVFPSWFLESFFCLCLFFVLHYYIKERTSGLRTAIYLCSYSVFRFFAEYLRGDSIRGYVGPITTSQFLSILVFVEGVVILSYSKKAKMINYLLKKT